MKSGLMVLTAVVALVLFALGCGGGDGSLDGGMVSTTQTSESSVNGSTGDFFQMTLQADVSSGSVSDDVMDLAVGILTERLEGLGIPDYRVERDGSSGVIIQVSGAIDLDQVTEVIGRTAVLGFYDAAGFGEPFATLEDALAAAGITSELDLPTGSTLVFWPKDVNSGEDRYFVVTEPPAVTGSMIKAVQVEAGQAGSYEVNVEFDGAGAAALASVTQDLADMGAATGVSQSLVIVMDGTVEMAPTVREALNGGQAAITGNFTLKKATALAVMLQTGPLPLQLELVGDWTKVTL